MTDYLRKKVKPTLWAFAGTSFMTLRIPVVSMDFSSFLIFASSTLHLLDDNCFCRPSFSSSPKNFRSAVSVGCLVDFCPLGRIQFLILLIGPTYPLRSLHCADAKSNQNTIFSCLWCFWINLSSTGRHLDMYIHFFVDCKTGFEKHWFAYAAFTDSQPQQNLRWVLGLANKLDILCCWMIFRLIITFMLPLATQP
jgi:hypothetical protein